ncbi:hypothetical protein A464_4338 [Salmonella bongori N268-08]|uniref:Uncharacterized protein n=1 Tax=Salmonella bongori N268-08 TaxID=1197719 RepID=S5NFY6_SALBN|nr:hypothetical protein A464_4338 [Salmonella bongori N268-08]
MTREMGMGFCPFKGEHEKKFFLAKKPVKTLLTSRLAQV